MERNSKLQASINNAWSLFESLCEENRSADTEGKLTHKFLGDARVRLTRFEQWGEHCIQSIEQAENSTPHQKLSFSKAFSGRWARLESLLRRLQVLERERISLLHAVSILPDDRTLVPSLDSEHPPIKLGRRIELLGFRENIVISEFAAVSKRTHKIDSEPKKNAQRLWAEKLVQISKEWSGSTSHINIENRFDVQKAHAILNGDDEAFEKVTRESQEWCIARTYIENYTYAVNLCYKSISLLKKSYQPGESFSGEQLKQWKTLCAVVEGETCFVAGSLHPGEGGFALDIFSELRAQAAGDRPLLLIAPNTLEVGEEIRNLSQERGSGYSIRDLTSLSREDINKVDVIIIDTWGMLYDVYSLGSGAVVGGTFLANRHHSYTEALLWGVPVFTGYHQDDQERVIELVNQGTEKLVHQVSVDEASVIAQEWAQHLPGGMPESTRTRNTISFVKQIATVEPRVYEAFQWLRPELIYWIKELAANDNYGECPCLDDMAYLHIIHIHDKISPWFLELFDKYEADNSISLARELQKIEQETN